MSNINIYKIININNNLIYIGKTKVPIEIRFDRHKITSKKLKNYFHNQLRSHGFDCFKIKLIEVCNEEISNDREKYWISFYKSNKKEFGYNSTEGGDGISNPSEEIRLNNGLAHKGQISWNKGIPVSEEVKNKIRKKLKGVPTGRIYTKEEKEKSSVAQIERWKDKGFREKVVKGLKGRVMTEDAKVSFRNRQNRFWNNPTYRENMKGKIFGGKNRHSNADNISQAFTLLASKVYNKPDFECSPRGFKIKELMCSKIIIENPRNRIVQIDSRKLSLPFCIGEFCYYMRGENSLSTMQYYSKNMKNFSDDNLTLNSAYGYRIGFGKLYHPIINHNQFERCILQLQEDKDTRQAIIHIQTPDELTRKTLDLTCTLFLHFLIRDNKLIMITNMRSNDLLTGFCYDVFNFTMIQELMTLRLGVELGVYIHVADSLHIYEKDFMKIRKCIREKRKKYIPMEPLTKLELEELPFLLKNEESIRINNIIEFEHKSPIFKDFIKILLDYKKRKNDNNN